MMTDTSPPRGGVAKPVPTNALPADRSPAKPSFGWRFAPIAVCAAALGLAYAMGWQSFLSLDYLGQSRDTLKGFVAERWALAALCFVVIYFTAAAVAFPASAALTVFGGFLFGWKAATVLVELGAVAGASALFLAARSAFGESLRARIGVRAQMLAAGFEKDAFSYLLVLRLAPFLPFFLVNIAPALFRVRLGTFVAATAIGILPGVAAYSYLGQGFDSVLVAARNAGRNVRIADLVTPQITIAFIGLAAVALGATLVKHVMARRAA